jgi:hypothetical protein
MKKKLRFVKRLLLASLAVVLSGTVLSQVQTFNYTGTIETYTVPAGVTSISIQAYGAQGGTTSGGLGAGIYGEFSVVPGTVLNIVVGQQGIVNNCGGANASGGGGGGSFVWDPLNSSVPLVAAGGGGGGNLNYSGSCIIGMPGLATIDGGSGNGGIALGGVAGNGGMGDGPSGAGSGGGGWLSAGQNSSYGTGCTGGVLLPTFLGGNGSTTFGPGGEGGFGGGGGAVCGCGGGGGYSGGGGGEGSSCRAGGGGGGSYNTGLNQTNDSGIRSGNGEIIITVLCSQLTVSVSNTEICLGESITLNGSGLGTISWNNGLLNNVAFTPTNSGTYTFTASSTNSNDCAYSVQIDVFALPTVDLTAPQSGAVCGGQDIALTGSPAGGTYFVAAGASSALVGSTFNALTAGNYQVQYVYTDGNGCSNFDALDFTVNCFLGLEILGENGSLNIYPNPAQGNFSISSLSPINGTVQLFDEMGKLVFSQSVSQMKNKQFDIKSLSTGIYNIQITNDNEVYKGKLSVINK